MRFYRLMLLIIFFTSTVVLVHANEIATTADQRVSSVFQVWPIQDSLVYSKSKESTRLAKAYYNRGTLSYKRGHYDRAIHYLTLSLVLEPKAADTYFNRGLSYRRQHKMDEAIADFSSAIELRSDQPIYYFERGNAFIIKNDFEAAIRDCSQVLRLSPRAGSQTYFLRGLAYMLNGDLEKALADSLKALQLDPDYTDAKRLLAETLTKMKR